MDKCADGNENSNHNSNQNDDGTTTKSPRRQVLSVLQSVDTNALSPRRPRYVPAGSEAAAARIRRTGAKVIAHRVAAQNVGRGSKTPTKLNPTGSRILQSGIVTIDFDENADAPAAGGKCPARTADQISKQTKVQVQGKSWAHVEAMTKTLKRLLKYRAKYGSCPPNVTSLVGLSPEDTDRIFDEKAGERADDRTRTMQQVTADVPSPPEGTMTVSNSYFAHLGGAVQRPAEDEEYDNEGGD